MSTGARAASSDWVTVGDARLRLHLVGVREGGTALDGPTLYGAVEVMLPRGWHTYWRTSGDVGLPTRFRFDGSANVARAETLFSLPERLTEGATVSLVYPDTALFPLRIVAADPTKPTTLTVAAELGVCREICIPVFADLSVTRDPGADAGDETAARSAIEQTLRRVPPVVAADAMLAAPPVRDGDTLRLEVTAAPGPVDLFAEGPEGWFLAQPKLAERGAATAAFTLDLRGRPRGATVSGAPIRLTITRRGGAAETAVVLP